MAFTFINSATLGSTGGGSVTTNAVDMTGSGGADFFVMVTSSYNAGNAMSGADSGLNTWAPLTRYNDGVLLFTQLFYTTNYPATNSASQTFTGACSGTGSFPSAAVIGFKGVHATTPFDAGKDSGGATIAGTTVQPGSLTPSVDNALVIAGLSFSASESPSIDSGYSTPITTNYQAGNHFGVSAAYLIETTATPTNPTWTVGASVDMGAVLGVFLTVAGGVAFVAAPGLNIRQAVRRGSLY